MAASDHDKTEIISFGDLVSYGLSVRAVTIDEDDQLVQSIIDARVLMDKQDIKHMTKPKKPKLTINGRPWFRQGEKKW